MGRETKEALDAVDCILSEEENGLWLDMKLERLVIFYKNIIVILCLVAFCVFVMCFLIFCL